MIPKLIFPAKEPCTHYQRNDILGRNFGIPDQITAASWHDCLISSSEITHMYIITLPQTHLNSSLQYHAMKNCLGDILMYSLPWTMDIQDQNKSAKTNAILEDITYSKGTQYDSVKF